MKSEAGFVQVWSLLLLLLVGSTANLAAMRARRLQASRVGERAAVRGLYAAEAGIAKARVLVRAGQRHGSWKLRVGAAAVTLELESRANGHVTARSQAILWPNGRNGLAHRVSMRVVLKPGPGLPRIVERYEAQPR